MLFRVMKKIILKDKKLDVTVFMPLILLKETKKEILKDENKKLID